MGVGTSYWDVDNVPHLSAQGGEVSGDPLDVELEDSDLLAEVDLTATLIAAANLSEGPLDADEIDRLLGLG